MNNNHSGFIDALKNIVSWVGTGIGWALSDITLSRAALIASIIYSIVNVWLMLERRGKAHGQED